MRIPGLINIEDRAAKHLTAITLANITKMAKQALREGVALNEKVLVLESELLLEMAGSVKFTPRNILFYFSIDFLIC